VAARASTWVDLDGCTHLQVEVPEGCLEGMGAESLVLMRDALWLLQRALSGWPTEGPVTLPYSGMAVRRPRSMAGPVRGG